jgi:hypothetical protein
VDGRDSTLRFTRWRRTVDSAAPPFTQAGDTRWPMLAALD